MKTHEDLVNEVRSSNSLANRLKQCQKIVTVMTVKQRGPRISIPPQWYDEDIFISVTIEDAVEALNGKVTK
ncbi:MAG: hypothetical protein GY938_26980 [Ketobacter sp.]|nr:hypothetical protein [Ketobacter sp.]